MKEARQSKKNFSKKFQKKQPLSTPSVYFTFASILPKIAKASTCDTNVDEAAQNASENNHQHQMYSGAFTTIFLSVQKEIVSTFLVLEFLFAKYKVELTKISVFIISRRSLPTVLICWSCCQNHLFVSYPLPPRVFSIFDQEFGGKQNRKLFDMYLLRPIVSTKKT